MDIKTSERLKELIEQAGKLYKPSEIETLKKAVEFAALAHAGERRLSGEEFVLHPIETARTLIKWRLDPVTVTAGILHDTIEHGAATEKDISDNFGFEVFSLVQGVTKVSKVKLRGKTNEEFVENLRRMFLAMAKDLRVVLLRFAERIDNLETLDFMPEKDRIAYAKESLEIFSPLAERLGMWDVKTRIDELAFRHAFPEDYTRVKNLSDIYFKDAQNQVNKMKDSLDTALKKAGIDANIYGRKKGLYSIFNKLNKPEIDGDIKLIHDAVALRILVSEVKECYFALGIVHSLYKPVPHIPVGDFIAAPKPNGYRSIHAKVFGPDGKIAEVQIRTYEMHEEDEFGASSHFSYNEIKSKGVSDEVLEGGKVVTKGHKLAWVKQLAEWQKEIKDSGEFLRAVKFDALAQRIFALTPEGDVYDLPKGSTPVDFAYAVHTELGKYVSGAKADEKIVPLNYLIQSGQVIEILKSKNPKTPSKDWLDFAVTTLARREIKKQLNNA